VIDNLCDPTFPRSHCCDPSSSSSLRSIEENER